MHVWSKAIAVISSVKDRSSAHAITRLWLLVRVNTSSWQLAGYKLQCYCPVRGL